MHLVLKNKTTDEYNIIAYEDFRLFTIFNNDYLYDYHIVYINSYEDCYKYCMNIIEGEC